MTILCSLRDLYSVCSARGSTSDASAYKHAHAHTASGRAKGAESASVPGTTLTTFARMPDYFSEERPFVVLIGKKGVLGALEQLDAHLRTVPTDWIGKEIAPGMIGLINHGGLPKLLTKPGRYPGFPLRNWWARSYKGMRGLSDTVINFQGLTVVQVSQNQAAVIIDPQNHIFVLKNTGFVAYGVTGSYDVLAIVDQTNLPNLITDHVTGAILGHSFEVRMTSATSGNDLELLPAGQHCITHPNVTLRGLYTLGEDQFEMRTNDIFTRDQVPVSLTLYLKWQLEEPLKLATYGYRDTLRRASGQGRFLDALRTHAMDDLHASALEYGIILKEFAVVDRRFNWEIASTMNNLAQRTLRAQVEAANVDRENSNKVKQEEGVLAVARIQGPSPHQAYSTVAAAKAAAERTRFEAEAATNWTRLAAEAEAASTRIRALADAEVADAFAQEMSRSRQEAKRVAVFVPTEAMGAVSPMLAGMAAGIREGLRE
ncbi:hypothetical protein BJY52DRAFT_1206183 [Lactarius psammicola]|nr:hypothetical protein BJY52DRAFT_1206183 [Lactarius psammicola]